MHRNCGAARRTEPEHDAVESEAWLAPSLGFATEVSGAWPIASGRLLGAVI